MINSFNGEYNWLSNFFPCQVIIRNLTYPSVEHGYQSMKSEDEIWKEFCRTESNPGTIKKLSRKVQLIPNWRKVNLMIMNNLVTQKFTKEPFKTKLLETGEQVIQEGNWWGDDFWGFCFKTNQGKNLLGEMIMRIRNNLKNDLKNN